MTDSCPEIYIGVGSNIEPEDNIAQAFQMLGEEVALAGTSSFYRTPPLSNRDQSEYLNGVWQIETDLPARELKEGVLLSIEERLHRRRTCDKYASRTIDLDVLLYGDMVCRGCDLKLPDPDIYTRDFIAIPLHELNPQLVLPDTGKAIAEVVDNLSDTAMRLDLKFTERLERLL